MSTQLIDDQVQFYLPYPLDNSGSAKARPIGNDGEEIFTMLTGQVSDFSFATPNGTFESPIGNGVTTKGGYFMIDLQHEFENDWHLSSKAKVANYDHWFNLFLDGDGTHNVPEDQAGYLVDRSLPANATFSYVDNGDALAGSDLLFQNRVLDRRRPMQEMVAEINLTKEINNHTITAGTFMSNTKAEDDNWIYNYLGDFRNAPRLVQVDYVDAASSPVTYNQGGFISGAQTSNNHLESMKTAVYLADQIELDKFNFDIGVRWERAQGIISKETGVGSNTFNRGSVEASDFALALAGLYKINDKTNVYANFSKGYFFPELRGVKFSNPGETQSYETEGTIQSELGMKFGGSKLSATAALFYVTLSDRRSIDFVNDPNDATRIIEEVNIQSTQTVGLESTVNYTLSKGLNLYGNVTYQQHEFTKFEGNAAFIGNKLRRQPNVMGMIGANYERNGFDANLSSNFMGSKFADDANANELDGYSIVRLDAGYKFNLGKVETLRLGVSVFNLLDSEGVTEGSPRQGSTQTAGDYFVGRPILPRRVFLRATFDF